MPTEQAEKINEVFPAVLETIAFMFAEPVPADELRIDAASPIFQAEIRFTGPTSGRLTLLTPEGICGELMVNMLGIEPGDQDDEIPPDEVLKELLNVTCGQLLTAIAGDEPVFNLSPPEVKCIDINRWKVLLESPEAFGFLVEDTPVLLRLTIDD